MRPPSLLLAAALAAWVFVVFGTLSTESRFNTYVNPHGKSNALEAASRAGMSSLTFVFDRTGSMFDDLDQVRRGTEGIFNTVMKQRERFIYNYVLVMFHDPDVDDAVVTTEPQIFHQKLRHVNLSGGQDCPEMTLTGIKKALEASLPGSFIFVFTDARSKDFHLIDSVLNLIQEKQTSVVFVMTGDCGDRNHTGYKVFDKIASASFGHVFHLQKSQVTQILAYVRESVSHRRVYLVFEDRLNGQTSTSEVPVDSHLHVLAVSLSLGKNEHDSGKEKEFLEVSIVDPKGNEYTIDSFKNDNSSINLNSVKLFRIEKPMPGMWKVKTSSDNRNSLRIYGHGEMDFRYGFTTIKHENQDILLAQSRPFANQNTYIWVNVTDVNSPGQVERVSIVDYQGKEMFGAPVMMTPHNPNLYVVGPFLPPKGMHFFVRIEGIDDKDYKFVRIASTAVSSYVLKGPKASMLPTTPATLHQSVNLTCNIEAKGPYEVTWKHNNRPLTSMPLYFAKSDTATWPISYVERENAGQYLCIVTSKDGNHTAATVLDMFEPPPEIVSLRNASAVLNGPAVMHCQTQTAEPKFNWYRNGMPVPSGPSTYTYSNGSLVIFNTRRIDAGAYVCQVTTRGGAANATIHLAIFELPTVRVVPKDIFVVENSYFQLNCTSTGVPPPRVGWFHQGVSIDFTRNNAFAVDRYNNLRVYSGTNVKGTFECRANNVAGTASDYSSVNLAERPIINIPKDEYVLGQGDNVVLECQVLRGQPTPRIHWERNGALFASEGDVSNKYIYQKYGNLHIRGASEIDAGDYTCVAENTAGKDSKITRVNIGIAPSVLSLPSKFEATIYKKTQLQCKALGNPLPRVAWYRNGVLLPVNDRFVVGVDGTLTINNVQYNDAGMYVCRATNNYGTQDRSTQLFVVGLEAPVLSTLPPQMQVLEDNDVRIECIIVMGIPTPERIWFKNGKPVDEDLRVFFDGEGSIVIKSVTPADEGVYTCQAKNVVGSASQMTRITMISRPRIPESAQLHAEVGVTPGESLDVPCPVVGNPAPKIVWLLNGHLIDLKHEEYEITFENTLRIKNVNRMHTGTFTCKAVNVAGETSIDTRVSVLTPPVITPGQTSFNHVQGDSIVLPCEVDGEPAPEILWTFNEAPAPGEIDSSGSLIVDNITEEHRGEYRCIARNSVGSDEAAINVTVHTAPIIDGSDVPKTLVIKVNDTAVLPCPARATPPPLRIWMYEGERIELPPEAAHIVEIRDDGALVLKATQLEHEGIYECHVSNLAGEDSVIYQLHVQDPPRIISDVPGSFDIVLGLRLDIPCRAIGAPRPVISWQKDGFEIISNSDAEVDPTGTLHIAASTLASEGTYRCVARNPAGEDARSTTVLVREAPIRTASQIDEYTHIEGETAKLKCDVKATPVPIYRWFIGDTEVAADTSRHTMLSDGTLEVTNVGKNDNVVYRCQAENSAGQVDIPIRLAVITSPEITDPDVVEYESIKEHDPFSLYCPVTSHPLPQINWKMDTRPLVADDNVIFSDDMRRLRVLKSKVSDAGIYTCLARNPAGKTTKTFQVEVLVPPQKDETIDGDHITVFEHQPVTMSCPVSGIPIPTIEWYINMVVLKSGETKNGVTVSEDGETITISNALLEHQGTFTCVATSKAGSLPVDIELTVLAPPQVGPNETLSAIIGKAVTLICDVKNEGPKSSITWLFNSKKELPSTAQTTPNAKKLIILSVNNEHTGAFECLVRNTAGESRKRFDLDVWAAPTFTDSQVAHEIQLIAGQEKFLKCLIAGNPTPTIEWKRDNLPILEGVSADHQILRIRQNEHGRYRYTCVATNKAGTVFRDFVVETITPPRLAGGGEAGGVQLIEIIQGHSATLDCPIATSQSAIKMDWIRDGREIERGTPRISIMADGTRLLMGNVQQEDESVFTCVAKNPAGEDSRNFKLVVLVPPRLEGAMVENVDIIEGDELDLECMFSAYPDPAVAWTKNLANLPEKFTLLNEDRSAYLETTTPTDAGAYQCRLTNAAGTAEKTFNVRVISAPKLIDSGSIKVIEASQGMPVTLKCPIAITSEANSNIEVTWTHNKLPLSPDYIFNNGFSILAGGYQLYLPKAHVADAGTYACVAKNEAGESVKNFNLLVLVKPHILSDHGDFKVVENNTIVLPCEVDGSPTPDIVWTKDDKLAANLTDVAILSGGQQFKILAANLEHQGKYKCTASNKIGSSDISFDVDVITRPTIAQSVQNIIETVKNDKAVFDCTVENRDFDGEITWFKNYDPIIPGDKYTLMKSGRKLVVNSVDLSDEASYSCKVRNDAGTATVNYSLSVLVPPTIIILEKDKNRTVVENSSLTLSCPATGKPEPKIRWFKDGELVLAENITTKINSGKMKGNDLRIEGIMLINDGTFTCEAKNDAGVVEQDVNVYVMTPPVILRDNISSDIQGKRSSHTEIQCFSTGRPTPTVTWLKNGRPLEKTPNVYLSSNHMRLHLTHLTDRHVDKYTCIARNPAGEDKRDFTLTLLEVPKINTSNLPKTIETNARRTTSLSCPAVGHPEPAIHWLRDGMALPTDDERFVFLNGGKTLQIKDLRTTDKARYMCMAENDVGFADYSVDLRVIGPPEIKGHAIETIIGLINSPKELRCEVTGTQPITIEWLKAGRALGSEASAFIQATNQGQRLHHLSAQRGDSALYTCVAKNAAGEARKNFDFQVQIPPSINDSISSPLIQSALPEGDFKVECIVDAIPEANIKWFHNGNPVTADGVVLTLSNKNQTLFVHKVDESHGGAYTCKAENPVGQTSRKYLVNLAAVPTFAISKETVNVYIGHHVTLNCKTNGGTGRISTIWLLNGRPAKQGNNSQTVHVEGKKIRINKIRFSDAGDYVCIARNEAGEARKTYNIHVLEKPRFVDKSNTSIAIIIGRPFTLDCVVHGTPRRRLSGSSLTKISNDYYRWDNETQKRQSEFNISKSEQIVPCCRRLSQTVR